MGRARADFGGQKLRDNSHYRASNARAQAAILPPSAGLAFRPWRRFSADSPREEPSRARDPTSGRRHSMGIHSIGIHSYGMEWIGMQCIAIHSIPMDSNRLLSAEGNGSGKTTNESGDAFTTFR